MYRTLLVIFLAACGSKPAPLPKETHVELISRGKAPFVELRYKIPKGTSSTLDVGVASIMMDRKTPKLTTTVTFTVDDVLPDGQMKLKSKVDRTIGTSPDGAPLPSELVAFYDGTEIAGTLSPLGLLTDTKITPGPKQLPTKEMEAELERLPKMMAQAAIAVPNAPVGVGATWRSQKTLDENGVKISATTTIGITKIEGSVISYTRTTQLTGPDQTIIQNGMSVALSQISGTGSGTGTIDLAKFAITSEVEDMYTARVRDKKAADATDEPFAVTLKMTIGKTP